MAVAPCPLIVPPAVPASAIAMLESEVRVNPTTTVLRDLVFIFDLASSETATHTPKEAFHITLYILFIGYSSLNFVTEGTLSEYLCAVHILYLMMCKLQLYDRIYNIDLLDELKSQSSGWQLSALKQALVIVQEAYDALVSSVGMKTALETMALKIDKIYKE